MLSTWLISGLENVLVVYIALQVANIKIKGNVIIGFILPLFFIRLFDILFFLFVDSFVVAQVYTMAMLAMSTMYAFERFYDDREAHIEEISKVALKSFLVALGVALFTQTIFIIVVTFLGLNVWEDVHWYSIYIPRIVMGIMYYISAQVIGLFVKG